MMMESAASGGSGEVKNIDNSNKKSKKEIL